MTPACPSEVDAINHFELSRNRAREPLREDRHKKVLDRSPHIMPSPRAGPALPSLRRARGSQRPDRLKGQK